MAVILNADCIEAMAALPEASVDAIVTDPPYGLGFMGAAWDDLPPGVDFAREALRVLKPGGHLLAFGASRTWHRLAVAIEDGGFEIRDSIAWLRAQGMPKGTGVLKTYFEPIVVARKGKSGPLMIDAARIGSEVRHNPSAGNRAVVGLGSAGSMTSAETAGRAAVGRWPSNVILDEGAAEVVDSQGPRYLSTRYPRLTYSGAAFAGGTEVVGSSVRGYEDAHDGVSRFFYTAKASKAERPEVDGVKHPTVKPLALMRYLIRLVTPPGGIVLDPFAGSGTTIEAAILEGFEAIGIEREASYLPLIQARMDRARA